MSLFSSMYHKNLHFYSVLCSLHKIMHMYLQFVFKENICYFVMSLYVPYKILYGYDSDILMILSIKRKNQLYMRTKISNHVTKKKIMDVTNS